MRRITVALVLLLVFTACGPSQTSSELTTIRLPMGFVANVQFAPWYVAVERGYFAAEGIQLDFDYSWETDGVRLVGAGELPFAIASGDQVLLARSQGLPVVTVVNWWQRFPVAVVSLEESGIEEPADLAGRRLGIPETFGASYIGWRALAATTDLGENVELEVVGYTQLANLTEGRVDAAVVYANNEPVQLEQSGYEFFVIHVADYASIVSNGLITNQETIQENPGLIRAVTRAFLRGLADTLDDPEAALAACREYVEGLEENEETQRAVLEASLAYWQGDPLGWSSAADWQATAQAMLEAELLSDSLNVEEAFSNEFLP